MSLDRVKTAVIDNARAEAENLTTTAKHNGEKLISDAIKDAEQKASESIRELKLRLERETARVLGRVGHEGRLAILEAKNHCIDEVFRQVRQQIKDLDKDKYANMVIDWLLQLPQESSGVIRANSNDVDLFSQKLGEINDKRPAQGKFSNVTVDNNIECGVMVDGPDFTADCTLDRRLNQLRETASGDLARVLFGA